MWRLWIETDARSVGGLAAHLERFGCRVLARDGSRLAVAFPQAVGERDALAEAALYLSLWPARPQTDVTVLAGA